jgi:hypothetical protein
MHAQFHYISAPLAGNGLLIRAARLGPTDRRYLTTNSGEPRRGAESVVDRDDHCRGTL